jgi:hypothetical protein
VLPWRRDEAKLVRRIGGCRDGELSFAFEIRLRRIGAYREYGRSA